MGKNTTDIVTTCSSMKLIVSSTLLISSFFNVSALAQSLHSSVQVPDNTTAPTDNYNMPVTDLDPIVVTATRSQKYLSNTPIALQIIDQSTLQQHHAHTLKEALQLLPNVNLVPLHGKTGYEVRMQGFSGDQVLILIDGLPISASTGSTVNLNQYLNTNVEQIEVIQGAASAQYGSSAMGGVINVITKPIANTEASITAELGSNGSQNPSGDSLDNNRSYIEASIEGALSDDGRIRARLSGSYLEDQGLSLDTDAWSLLKDPSEQMQLNAKVTYTPNINELGYLTPDSQYWLDVSLYSEKDISRFDYYVPPRYLAQQRDEDINRQRLSFGGHTMLQNNSDVFLGALSNSLKGDYKLSGSFLYENYDSQSDTKSNMQSSNPVITSDRDTEIDTTLVQVQLDVPVLYQSDIQSHAIQLGTSWRLDTLEQTKNNISELVRDDVDRDVIEAYLQDDWILNSDLEIVLGARYQDDSDFGSHFSPKLALMQDYFDDSGRKHTFRVSVGEGYRVPNLKERYYVFDHSNFGYKVMGNPDLVPETSTSYQLGYETNITNDLAFSINGFYNDVKDLIQTDNDNPNYVNSIAIYSYDNIDEAQTYGADTALGWQINNKTSLKLAYTYLHTENKNTGSDLTYSPEHKVTSNLEYQLNDKLQLLGQARYESEQLVNTASQSYSPSWWGLDGRANYNATPNLQLYLAINNLLDEQREVADPNDQRPVDNRQWILGASYHW